MATSAHVRDVSPSEKYGFVVHVICFPIAAAYLVWALVPDEILHYWNITYYAPKEWATLVPTYLLCVFVAAPFIYAAFNILSTPKIDSVDTMCDASSGNATVNDAAGVCCYDNDSTLPEIQDVDVSVINRYVYDMYKNNKK